MKTRCFSILAGLLTFSVAWAQQQAPTADDAERELGPFRDFLIALIQQGKLPQVKTNEHASINGFRVNGEAREAWLTKKMQREVKGCKDAFLATVEIPMTHRHLQYLYCKEGNSFLLISVHKEKTVPWPKTIEQFPPEVDPPPASPPKQEKALRRSPPQPVVGLCRGCRGWRSGWGELRRLPGV